MPSFTEPGWLIGLAAIPLIWWLHRLGDAEAATPVSAAFLFYGTEQDRIDRHQREIDRIEYQLISEELTDKQRDYLLSKKQELRDLIKCIREDKC